MNNPSAENQNGHVQPLDITIADLAALRGSRDNTWRKIAAMDKYQGIPAGTLCAILKHGREPKKPEHRKILGLPPVAVSVEPCPDCGEAHLVGWCVKVDGPPVKPKPTYNRKPSRTWPSYFKGSQTDIEQVARQLEKYWPDYEIIKKEK